MGGATGRAAATHWANLLFGFGLIAMRVAWCGQSDDFDAHHVGSFMSALDNGSEDEFLMRAAAHDVGLQ